MITCLLCRQEGIKFLSQHLRKHKMSVEVYREKTGYTGSATVITSEARKNMNAGIKAMYDEELRAARTNQFLTQWADPEMRSSRMKNMKGAKRRKADFQAALLRSKRKRSSGLATSSLRTALYARAESRCEKCGKTEAEEIAEKNRKLHLHHLNNDKIIAELEDVMLLCSWCHGSLHGNGTTRERYEIVTKVVGNLLRGLRVNIDDENFIETPRRFATYLLEHFMTKGEVDQALEELQSTTFPSDSGALVLVKDVEVYGICPHHLLPIFYKIDLAYIPNGRVIGLSKLARLADLCARQPLLQESMVVLLTVCMKKLLGTEDVAALATGEHLCMRVRGPQQAGAQTVTSSLSGCFETDSSSRAELMTLCNV